MPRQMLTRDAQRRQRAAAAEEFITQDECARRAGCSWMTIHRACKLFEATRGRAGLGPVLRRSRKFVRVPVSAFERWMGAAAIF